MPTARDRRMRILVFCATYVPGNRGGTVRAVEGLAHCLGQELDLFILTRDREPGASKPFDGLSRDVWCRAAGAMVYYASPGELRPGTIRDIIRDSRADGYYVNSLFSPLFGALPVALLRVGAIPQRRTILAPRGELHPDALRQRRVKKQVFLRAARVTGAYRDILWQAGSTDEAHHIRSHFPRASIAVARDLSALEVSGGPGRLRKGRGELSMVYLSRITPMKNLLGAIRALSGVRGDVQFDVFGPVMDDGYHRECKRAASSLPANVRVRFLGELAREHVLETLRSYHVFVLPSLGESFGHAILEAMVAGCVVVISDRTPWRMINEANLGYEVPVNVDDSLRRALQACVDMGEEEFSIRSEASRERGVSESKSAAAIAENRSLFQWVTRS